MLALGWMNVGAAMAPDAALASVISAILVIVGNQSIGAGIAVAIPIAAAGQVLTIFVRTITVFFQHLADKYAEKGNTRGIEMCHILRIITSRNSCSCTSCYSRSTCRYRCCKCSTCSYSTSNYKRTSSIRWIYSSCRICNGN